MLLNLANALPADPRTDAVACLLRHSATYGSVIKLNYLGK